MMLIILFKLDINTLEIVVRLNEDLLERHYL